MRAARRPEAAPHSHTKANRCLLQLSTEPVPARCCSHCSPNAAAGLPADACSCAGAGVAQGQRCRHWRGLGVAERKVLPESRQFDAGALRYCKPLLLQLLSTEPVPRVLLRRLAACLPPAARLLALALVLASPKTASGLGIAEQGSSAHTDVAALPEPTAEAGRQVWLAPPPSQGVFWAATTRWRPAAGRPSANLYGSIKHCRRSAARPRLACARSAHRGHRGTLCRAVALVVWMCAPPCCGRFRLGLRRLSSSMLCGSATALTLALAAHVLDEAHVADAHLRQARALRAQSSWRRGCWRQWVHVLAALLHDYAGAAPSPTGSCPELLARAAAHAPLRDSGAPPTTLATADKARSGAACKRPLARQDRRPRVFFFNFPFLTKQ